MARLEKLVSSLSLPLLPKDMWGQLIGIQNFSKNTGGGSSVVIFFGSVHPNVKKNHHWLS